MILYMGVIPTQLALITKDITHVIVIKDIQEMELIVLVRKEVYSTFKDKL